MRRQFKETVTNLAAVDPRVVLVFGDISVYLFNDFAERFPAQFYNLGICENTLISVSAGLRSQGFIPFVHSIAPFMTERCVEQIKLDLCYNHFPANIVTCGATYDYAWDGPTHHCLMDLAILRLLPDVDIFQPGSKTELDSLIRSQYDSPRTNYFRLSDHGHNIPVSIRYGKGEVIRNSGAPLTVITAGPILANVVQACADLNVNLLYFPTIKPFDNELLNHFRNTRMVVIHDATGLFETVCEVAERSVQRIGIPEEFVLCYGTIQDVWKTIRLDPASIRNRLESLLLTNDGWPRSAVSQDPLLTNRETHGFTRGTHLQEGSF